MEVVVRWLWRPDARDDRVTDKHADTDESTHMERRVEQHQHRHRDHSPQEVGHDEECDIEARLPVPRYFPHLEV